MNSDMDCPAVGCSDLGDRAGQTLPQSEALRKVAEGERTDRRLLDVLESLPALVCLLTRDYRIVFANRLYRELFGEPHGRRCFELLFQREQPCENCETCKALEVDGPYQWEWTGPDGRDYDVYDCPFIDADGHKLVLKMGVDVTARKQAQLELAASEARYRSLATASTQIIWTTDAQGRVIHDMPSWRAFTGQTFGQIQGGGWADALHPDDRQRALAVWSQAVATGSLYAAEYRVRRHDGQYRHMSVRAAPVLAGGNVREWVGACTDVTDLKRAEEEALHIKEELAHVDRMARMGEVTASLAHELNQPLTAILSNAQAARRFLASDAPDLGVVREILDDIVREDKRAGAVIHHLRLMLQKKNVPLDTFDVNEAICEVTELLHSEILGRNGRLRMELAAKLPAVRAARVEIQQVLVNLVLNGLNAMSDAPRDCREICVRTSTQDGDVVVAVRDRGCGIPSTDMERVFDPFFTTRPAGLGMGLAICRRMICSHGGRIWAANNEDVGATVSFSLPSVRTAGEASHV